MSNPSEVANPKYMPVDELRKYFEDYIRNSKRFKDNTPLGIVVWNDNFSKYMDSDTDTMWIGFSIGMRYAMSRNLTSTSTFSKESKEPKAETSETNLA